MAKLPILEHVPACTGKKVHGIFPLSRRNNFGDISGVLSDLARSGNTAEIGSFFQAQTRIHGSRSRR
jgi:hypothetical protein